MNPLVFRGDHSARSELWISSRTTSVLPGLICVRKNDSRVLTTFLEKKYGKVRKFGLSVKKRPKNAASH